MFDCYNMYFNAVLYNNYFIYSVMFLLILYGILKMFR